MPEAGLGTFDFVFCLGILYHLKHPLLALEIVCALTTDTAIVESFVTDANTWREHQDEVPTMEFYETDELGNQLDNWIGPSVSCLMAMCRAAGFARVRIPAHHRLSRRRRVPSQVGSRSRRTRRRRRRNCSRWPIHEPSASIFPPAKRSTSPAGSARANETVTRDQLRLEVGDFGVPALYVRPDENGSWMANFRLPPGLPAGWNAVRLRFADTTFGNTTLRIAVDQPLRVEKLVLEGACDGTTWNAREVRLAMPHSSVVGCAGLPENCDRANIGVYLGESKLRVQYVGTPDAHGMRQINAVLPVDTARGE